MEILIPGLGDIDEVEVIEICVAPGDTVSAEDTIIVIESDKASMDVPAPVSGVIKSIEVATGDMVSEGHLIAVLQGEEAGSESNKEADPPAENADSSADEETPAVEAEPVESPQPVTAGQTQIVDVAVPDIGDANGVVVIEVAVSVGDSVAEHDLLVVLESDKASMELTAEHSGTITEVLVEEGQEVAEGTLVAKIETSESAATADNKESQSIPDAAKAPAPSASDASTQKQTASAPSSTVAVDTAKASQVYAGPAVRKLARELGVKLEQVTGSGSRGRITKDDVKGFVKQQMKNPQGQTGGGLPQVAQVDFSKFGEVELVDLTRIQQRGADNLHRSWVNLPHVTQHDEADITDLEEFRKSLKAQAEQKGVKVTPLAFLMKVCAHALKAYPMFNASLHEDHKQLVVKKYINIGMAVDTPDGLVVPVIKDADQKSIWELSADIAEMGEKARNKKLGMDDMQGGTFSISSLGALGGTGFTPIVNAPEVAILGVAKLQTKPLWNGAEFVPRKVLPLSLSYDHRVINGADGGRFMVMLTQTLQDLRLLTL